MTDLPGRRPPPLPDQNPSFRQRLENLAHLGRLVAQIWRTSRSLTLASLGLRLLAALQPVAVLYVGKLIVDEVVRLTAITSPGPRYHGLVDRRPA
jgi:ATP-binding cassette subfamily B protein